MKVLVIGYGSIAKKHIRVLTELINEVEIFAFRSKKPSANADDIVNIYDWREIAEHEFHFALIASPSSLHLDQMLKLSKYEIPMMVEKPLFVSKEQIKLWESQNLKPLISYVACNLRFHPVIEYLKKYLAKVEEKVLEINAYCGSYLPDWRPGQDYRATYSAKKNLGGGVHLDLIHEPDYLVYLFGTPQKSTVLNTKTSNLEIDSFDYSNILFQYVGFNAQIVLNYYRRDTKRTLEIVFENHSVFADLVSNSVIDLRDNSVLFNVAYVDNDYTYRKQMQYFLSCIKSNINPMNSLAEATEILKYIL